MSFYPVTIGYISYSVWFFDKTQSFSEGSTPCVDLAISGSILTRASDAIAVVRKRG